MILLLGGTSDTDPIARVLVNLGQKVLVSTVTDYPLTLMTHQMIQRRSGALDEDAFRRLIGEYRIVAVVDATHPYTEVIGPLSRQVAAEHGIPYFRFLRPKTRIGTTNALHADGHPAAARIACSFQKPVLLTIGSKNVAVYVQAANQKNVPLFARVLDRKSSIDACQAEGVRPEAVIAAQGPFTVEENLALIRRFNIGVLVTKESGVAGGMKGKVEAVDSAGCQLVIVSRPQAIETGTFTEIDAMILEVLRII